VFAKNKGTMDKRVTGLLVHVRVHIQKKKS
jgi:hypothetical protein